MNKTKLALSISAIALSNAIALKCCNFICQQNISNSHVRAAAASAEDISVNRGAETSVSGRRHEGKALTSLLKDVAAVEMFKWPLGEADILKELPGNHSKANASFPGTYLWEYFAPKPDAVSGPDA